MKVSINDLAGIEIEVNKKVTLGQIANLLKSVNWDLDSAELDAGYPGSISIADAWGNCAAINLINGIVSCYSYGGWKEF